jgi:hypothetical protein
MYYHIALGVAAPTLRDAQKTRLPTTIHNIRKPFEYMKKISTSHPIILAIILAIIFNILGFKCKFLNLNFILKVPLSNILPT